MKLGRTSEHRTALLAGLVCNLIKARRITTTLKKAKLSRSLAEKMVTLGKRGTLSARRKAIQVLRQKDLVKILFETIAPQFKDRQGGYTRIMRLGTRASDSSEMVILEWVNYIPQPPKKKKKKKGEEKGGAPEADKAKAKTPPAKKKEKEAKAKK